MKQKENTLSKRKDNSPLYCIWNCFPLLFPSIKYKMAGRRNKNAAVKKRLNESRVIVGIEDMVLLHDTKDTGICENLKTRLRAEHIYTFIGHVLVACNPYKWLPIYEEHVMKQYVMQQRVDVAPHIFATAEAAYRSMIQEEDNQCVIISGESGAGQWFDSL